MSEIQINDKVKVKYHVNKDLVSQVGTATAKGNYWTVVFDQPIGLEQISSVEMLDFDLEKVEG